MPAVSIKKMNDKLIEKVASGADSIDRTWMLTFWEAFSDCVVETDAQYNVTNILRKTDSTFTMDEIIGSSFLDMAVDKEREFAASELDILKNSDLPYRRFTFLSKLGRYYRWTLIALKVNGMFMGFRGIAVDVTKQSLNEITLNWQRAIIEGSSNFISIADLDWHVLYINPGAYKMTGYDPVSDTLLPELIFSPEHLKAIRDEGMKIAITDGSWIHLGELFCRDGSKIPIEHNMFSIKNDKDETILIATIIRDVTDFVENEKKMEEARNAAESANAAKSEFLSRMSHEIRTPMNAIIGMINIGLGTEDVEKKNYCFRRADSASKHLLGIINDILDMSKIEAEKFELSFSEFDFEQALKNITNMANVRAEEKKQNFIVDISEDVPAFILSDELRLSQVITNLLTNAIKFTPEKGTVALTVAVIKEIEDDVVLKIEVLDTGIGISMEQKERLFMSFNQADSSISQKFGGTGLGLAISKRIVELMGGEIWIESELGKGARFIFTIKAKKAKERTRTKLSEKISRDNLRILAVDDSEDTRNYFCHVMETLKLSCDVASAGSEAIQMVKSAVERPYNIFFIDWQMPDMDGIELTKRIKELRGENSFVIMISAHDWNIIEKEAIAAGVRHFISKPLFPSTLINAINICIGAEINESKDEILRNIPKPSYDFYSYTILIAEDIEINREIMTAILEETNISIDYAENGKSAVSMFSANPEKYNLILMDINMPEIDGYEATRLIRCLDLEKARNIPIIAMTANVFKEDIEKSLKSGMNDHTGKPIDAAALLGILNKYLKNSGKTGTMKNVHELEHGIIWKDDLLTGNTLVDMQHQKIFEKVSDLVNACEDGSDIEKLEDTLAFLVNLAIRHFADEEALLLEYSNPDYEHHRNEHERFKKKVTGLVNRFKESGSSSELSGDVNRVFVRWFVDHIKNEDKMMSEYIRNKI